MALCPICETSDLCLEEKRCLKLLAQDPRGLQQPVPPPDMVNRPPHYTQGAIECKDAIRAALGRDGYIAWLRGQIFRYNWRLGLKDDVVLEAGKMGFYQQELLSVLKESK